MLVLAAFPAAAICLIALLFTSCNSKSPTRSNPEGLISPPIGIAFSIPGSEMTFFDLDECDTVQTQAMNQWAVVSAAINFQGSRLILADDNTTRIGVFSLPEFTQISITAIGGVPIDMQLSVTGSHAYIITANANFWIFSVSAQRFDTLETGLNPRRLTLRPPSSNQAWVACAGNSALYIYNLSNFQPLDTLYFAQIPTSVAFKPDGAYAYVALQGNPGIVEAFDANTREHIGFMEAGAGPFDLAMSSDGEWLAATDSLLHRVRFWGLSHLQQWDVGIGASPDRIRYSSNEHAFFVGCSQRSHIYRIDTSEEGPILSDSVAIAATVREFVLWETTQ